MLKALLIALGVVCVVIVVAVVGGLLLLAWALRKSEEDDRRGSLDWRLVPDPYGDYPHIPSDYRADLHKDPQKAWPENGDPRGA